MDVVDEFEVFLRPLLPDSLKWSEGNQFGIVTPSVVFVNEMSSFEEKDETSKNIRKAVILYDSTMDSNGYRHDEIKVPGFSAIEWSPVLQHLGCCALLILTSRGNCRIYMPNDKEIFIEWVSTLDINSIIRSSVVSGIYWSKETFFHKHSLVSPIFTTQMNGSTRILLFDHVSQNILDLFTIGRRLSSSSVKICVSKFIEKGSMQCFFLATHSIVDGLHIYFVEYKNSVFNETEIESIREEISDPERLNLFGFELMNEGIIFILIKFNKIILVNINEELDFVVVRKVLSINVVCMGFIVNRQTNSMLMAMQSGVILEYMFNDNNVNILNPFTIEDSICLKNANEEVKGSARSPLFGICLSQNSLFSSILCENRRHNFPKNTCTIKITRVLSFNTSTFIEKIWKGVQFSRNELFEIHNMCDSSNSEEIVLFIKNKILEEEICIQDVSLNFLSSNIWIQRLRLSLLFLRSIKKSCRPVDLLWRVDTSLQENIFCVLAKMCFLTINKERNNDICDKDVIRFFLLSCFVARHKIPKEHEVLNHMNVKDIHNIEDMRVYLKHMDLQEYCFVCKSMLELDDIFISRCKCCSEAIGGNCIFRRSGLSLTLLSGFNIRNCTVCHKFFMRNREFAQRKGLFNELSSIETDNRTCIYCGL